MGKNGPVNSSYLTPVQDDVFEPDCPLTPSFSLTILSRHLANHFLHHMKSKVVDGEAFFLDCLMGNYSDDRQLLMKNGIEQYLDNGNIKRFNTIQ